MAIVCSFHIDIAESLATQFLTGRYNVERFAVVFVECFLTTLTIVYMCHTDQSRQTDVAESFPSEVVEHAFANTFLCYRFLP